jgi:5'-deoxynucleotidase YfbR-like HD superfamily hydrolase
MDTQKLIRDFLVLQKGYQFTRRVLITKERFRDVAKGDKNVGLNLSLEELKEPLIEHVGHLPILATYFHEHIANKAKVDLGRALIMLSIHDIGETKLGDVFSYTKTAADEMTETKMAQSLLSPCLLPYFEEYEAKSTFDAKYAKSIDALAPWIHEIDCFNVVWDRFVRLGGSREKALAKTRPCFEWDTVLLEVFDMILEQVRRLEAGEAPLFDLEPYDISGKS